MSQLIVGLFANAEQAAQVSQELISIGVAVDQITTFAAAQPTDDGAVVASADADATLMEALRAGGMAEAQAHAHAEAVRAGAAAVLVRPADVPGANIKAVMLSHGSIDIDSSGAEPNTLGQRPHLEPEAAGPDLGLRDPGSARIGTQ